MASRVGNHKYKCRYPNCDSKYYNPIYEEGYYNKRFYRFPRKSTALPQWKDICKLDQSVVTDNFFVCEDHFVLEDFVNHSKHKLNPGVIPIRPSQPFKIGDHDYTESVDENNIGGESSKIGGYTISVQEYTNNPHHKYAFLFESNAELLANPDSFSAVPQSRNLTMLKIHEMVTLNLLRLKNVLHDEESLLEKLFRLYKYGKFDNIIRQLEHLSNEFIQRHVNETILMEKWSEDHLLALSFYVRNGKLYRYLCDSFHLPSINKLRHMLYHTPLHTGINQPLWDQVKWKASRMNVGDQTCALLMGEITLSYGVNYDDSYQHFCGYEDLGHLGRSDRAADRVLVLMARGLRKNWTQIVAYYFGSGPFKGIHLQNIIVTAVKNLQANGLKVVAFVCQQSSTNLDALALLTVKTKDGVNFPHFIVNGKRICVIFDVRYLLIETRNALSKCNVLYDPEAGKVAKFEHIESAYNLDQSKRVYKQLSKLKGEYFDVNNLIEGDFAAAAAVLSHAVPVCIESFILSGDLPQEAMDTADFVEIMDVLFDSLNSSRKKPLNYRIKYRCALSRTSPHLKFWSSLLPQFDKWKLIELGSEQDVTSRYAFIKGFKATIESLFHLWGQLRHTGYFNHLSLKRFNLEPLEELFKGISLYGPKGKSLTCHQFVSALKSEILNSADSSFITDSSYNLTSLTRFFERAFEDYRSETYFDDLDFEVIDNLGRHEEAAYLSGYLLRKINVPDCDTCRSNLLAEWVIKNTEIGPLKEQRDSSMYSLYASDSVVRIVDRILYLVRDFLRDRKVEPKLEDNFMDLYRREFDSFEFCTGHVTNETLISLCIKLGIYKFVCNFNDSVIPNK